MSTIRGNAVMKKAATRDRRTMRWELEDWATSHLPKAKTDGGHTGNQTRGLDAFSSH